MTPDISVLVAVYFPPGPEGALREEGFKQSVKSWGWNLLYDGKLAPLIVVNDGLEPPARLGVWWGAQRLLGHERGGLGASLNQGFKEAFETSPLVLHLVDDTPLDRHYDLSPWARMLVDDEQVGAVRLQPYPGTAGTISPRGKPNRGGWVVTMDRHDLVAGLRPTLYHRRFFDAYGYFDEGLSAWETERLFNDRFCQASGPESVLALPAQWAEGMGSTVVLGQVAPEGKS